MTATIHVRRAKRSIGLADVDQIEFPADGRTLGQVLGACYLPEWAGAQVHAAIDGRRVAADMLEQPLERECFVEVMPYTGIFAALAAAEFTFLAQAAVSIAVLGFLYGVNAVLNKVHKPAPIARGSEESPTRAWDGIQTASGVGFRVPIVYGLIELGGHVVSSEIETVGDAEYLRQTIVLGEGRFEAIGGLTGGVLGEADDLGGLATTITPIPENLRVNGNTLQPEECNISFRLGEIGQSIMRGYSEPSTVYEVNGDLSTSDSVATKENLDTDAETFALRFTFGGGLYELDATGNATRYPVSVEVSWSSPTSSSSRKTYVLDVPARRVGFSHVFTPTDLPFSGKGPFTVIVRRITPAGDPNKVVSACTLSKIQTKKSGQIAYAGRAVVGLRMRATEKLSGGQPQYRFRVKAKRVRVWDAVLGFSTPLWELPTSGSFAGIWSYPPGRNPAWQTLDLLTSNVGLARKLKNLQIDFQSFRNWADWCDDGVAGSSGTEARHCCDISHDSGLKAQDVLQQMLTTGRASLVRIGNTLSVRYDYRDAHGRGTNSVPATGGVSFNVPVAIFSSSNIRPGSLKLVRANKRRRPTVLHFQILNEELGYEPDSVAVLDPTIDNDPSKLIQDTVLRRQIDFAGVTRPSHARREGIHLHRIGAAANWTATWETDLVGLGIVPGDLVGLEHDVMRTDPAAAHYGYRTGTQQLTPASTVTLDHAVTISASPAWVAYVTQDDASVQVVGLAAGTYAAGAAIVTTAPVSFRKGVTVALGHSAKVLKLFRVSGVDQAGETDFHTISGTEFVSSIYDAIPADLLESTSGDNASMDDAPELVIPSVEAVDVARTADMQAHEVRFARPDRGNRLVRVFAKLDDGTWSLRGETRGDSLRLDSFAVGETVTLALAVQDRAGSFQTPESAKQVTIKAPEFVDTDTPAVRSLSSHSQGEALLLTWTQIDSKELQYYEVRRGPIWNGAEVIGRTREPFFVVEHPTSTAQLYQVRARFRGGLYSGAIASVTPTWSPNNRSLLASSTDLVSSAAGTHSSTTWDSTDKLYLVDSATRGTYTGVALDLGVPTFAWWSIALDRSEVELATWADMNLGAVDRKWATPYGREATWGNPGADFDDPASSWLEIVEGGTRIGGNRAGTIGTKTRVLLEVRFDTTGAGAWTAYQRFVPGWFMAQKAQVRLTLDRCDRTYQAKASLLAVQAFA